MLFLAGALVLAAFPFKAAAQDRYVQPPPIVVSPDLSAPWVLRLTRHPVGRVVPAPSVRRRPAPLRVTVAPQPLRPAPVMRQAVPVEPRASVQTASLAAGQARDSQGMDPKFLPREVAYQGGEKPGTIIIDTAQKFLFFVEPGGKAMRYGVGVGKEGFLWKGTEHVRAKKEWPGWTPPAEMIVRERKKGRILPAHMEGGPANPLGARALYLGDTLYRIHGTNAPWTIGHNVSSGCIRMRNEDVIDLYSRVKIGAKVVVI
jgi:lipoprotein-anchoring transpeptidase ErfK/SrfK